MNAEQLIDQYLGEAPPASIIKDRELTGAEVAKLKSKQHIFVDGKRAVVVDVTKKGDTIELVYVKGRKAFGKEQYKDIPANSASSGIILGKERERESTSEALTRGMHRAFSKNENGARQCEDCGLVAPSYPGRYPKDCPHCGGEMKECKRASSST